MWFLVLLFLGATHAWAEDLGELSANPFNLASTSNPFGAGSPFKPDGLNNPFAPMAVPSAINLRRIPLPQMHHNSLLVCLVSLVSLVLLVGFPVRPTRQTE